MKSQSVYKIPQGKLVKVSVEYDEDTHILQNIRITGDFFAYPEEAIEVIERRLKNTVMEQELLQQKISFIISQNHFEFIGLTAEGLTQGILMCLS
jgi:lipoate-protein ligase A